MSYGWRRKEQIVSTLQCFLCILTFVGLTTPSFSEIPNVCSDAHHDGPQFGDCEQFQMDGGKFSVPRAYHAAQGTVDDHRVLGFSFVMPGAAALSTDEPLCDRPFSGSPRATDSRCSGYLILAKVQYKAAHAAPREKLYRSLWGSAYKDFSAKWGMLYFPDEAWDKYFRVAYDQDIGDVLEFIMLCPRQSQHMSSPACRIDMQMDGLDLQANLEVPYDRASDAPDIAQASAKLLASWWHGGPRQ
jgi:hypothetical protein